MPVDDIYWNSIDFGSEEESLHSPSPKHYVDPWDLENYAYIREHLDSIDVSSDPSGSDDFTTDVNSTSFRYVPLQRDQNYEEVAYGKPRTRRMYSTGGLHRSYDPEFDENPYEVNMKDVSPPYVYDQDRWRKVPVAPHRRNPRDRSISFSYGDYETGQDIYCRLDEIRPKREATLPIYDDVRNRRQPRNFGLSNYGHLKIDYSYSWNRLDKYICN
ncbi:uncharacterized protein LOC100142083 [Tribolium castaneum]|uniref:Uncharacterized protein n=1 Tax=Tribolium castaneum TaxID=7070 RepID=D6X044_TRICA|nr:PREDICTED: uncharacterized protein LOC100142083 [Tribolium castaneum]XP_008191491.1 PREDICTED: uncharacterized protein LOC100142083 [Tribolium castaneum]EFA10072.1 hypothetical protein TcasGA2_TC012246 [Tribolium castaneum]|eukprot:XP_001807780.1 PREDICTED: uncharacterized protein LOC100142083 [Tribolium castaneum]